VFLVIRQGRRDVVRCAVPTIPTAAWVAQQLRKTFPFESAPRFLIFDRDAIFSAGLTVTIRSMLMEPARTGYRSSWQNGVADIRTLEVARGGPFRTRGNLPHGVPQTIALTERKMAS
jgi:hypothetical protein